MLRRRSCILVVCFTLMNLATSGSLADMSKLAYQNWNRSACQFTQYSRFEISESTTVASVVVWYRWQPDETSTPFSVITSDQTVIFSGTLSKGQCDPFQRRWCHAEAKVAENLAAGVYAIKVPKGQVCQNQESHGQGFARVYTNSGPSSGFLTTTAVKSPDEELVEILYPAKQGDHARGGETWVRKKNADGSFYMWVTGGRELQSLFMPIGSSGTYGWTRSTIFPGFAVNNKGYFKKVASMPAEKTGTVELLDPAKSGDPGHASETWVRLTNRDGSFHLWVTEGRQLHCLYKPKGSAGTSGWNSSNSFRAHVVKCNRYRPITLRSVGRLGPRSTASPAPRTPDSPQPVNSGISSQYALTQNAAISGHNRRHLMNVSTLDCMNKCSSEESFVCKSFDYYKTKRECDLSDKSANDVSGLRTNYGGNPYDHYARISSAGKSQPVPSTSTSDADLVEILYPAKQGDRARGGETWVRKKNADGSFYMWVTGGRELQSLFMPSGTPGTGAWTRSSIFPGFVVNNQAYIKKLASMPAEKTGTIELLDPTNSGDPGHASETWVRLTNHDGSFHLWITEGRQLHCLYKPKGSKGTAGWSSSSTFREHVVKCNQYRPIALQPATGSRPQSPAKQLSEAQAEALRNSGVNYYYGRGVPKDYKKALELFTKAGNAGNAAAQRSRGIMLVNGQGAPKNISEAVKWLLKAARQGDAAAQNRMGSFYKNGNGVAQDYHQARAWFQKAADQDNTSSKFYLGVFYDFGYGVKQNKKTAVEWYRRAAKLGHMDAQANLGNSLLHGDGVPKNPAKAVAWLRLGAEQGQSKAQLNLGYCYDHGIGLPKNRPEALRWYKKCAAKGNENCIENVKIMQNAGIRPATGPLPPPTIPKTVLLTPQTKPAPGRATKPLPEKGATSASPTPTRVPGSPEAVATNKPVPHSKPPPVTDPAVKPQPQPVASRPDQSTTKPISADPAASTGGFPGFRSRGTNKFGYKEFTHTETGMVFVLIPRGSFIMGTNTFKAFSPEHEVYIDDFLISKYEVTQGVWEKYMGEISTSWGYRKGSDFPVEHVSWSAHNEFVQITGLFLPTEAEWEKAVRAGTRTKFYWGDDYEGLDNNSWHEENSGKSTHPVGQKEPNGYGLYDMVGNVAEWCQDVHANAYIYYVNSPGKNPMGPKAGSTGTGHAMVHRGGSYRHGFRDYWSAGREADSPSGNGTAGSRPVFRLYKGE